MATSADQVVVGVAIVHAGRLLAARRTTPVEAAGRWELPGGKLEPGETESSCAVREIAEELGCRVRAVGVVDHEEPIKPGYTLRVVVAELVAGEPVPHEHDAIWWLARDELRAVDWLPPDLPFLPILEKELS